MTAAVVPKAIKTVLSKGRELPSLSSLTSTGCAAVVVVVVLIWSTDRRLLLTHMAPLSCENPI